MRITQDLYREPGVPAIVGRTTARRALAVTVTAVLFLGVLMLLIGAVTTGCAEPQSATDLPHGDKSLVARNNDARSKSSALFGTIGDTPEATAPVRRMAVVGERLNGAATPQDYDWARTLAASDKARDAALVVVDSQAQVIATLTAKLAAAPSPEDFAKAKERGDRVSAELDAFSSATARNGLIGAVLIVAGAIAAWQLNNARIFGWGVLASFSLNLEPYLVKRVAESPVLAWVIGLLIAAGGILAAYETWRSWRSNRASVTPPLAESPADAPSLADAPSPTPVATPSTGFAWLAAIRPAIAAWFAKAWAWVLARFGKKSAEPTPPAAQ